MFISVCTYSEFKFIYNSQTPRPRELSNLVNPYGPRLHSKGTNKGHRGLLQIASFPKVDLFRLYILYTKIPQQSGSLVNLSQVYILYTKIPQQSGSLVILSQVFSPRVKHPQKQFMNSNDFMCRKTAEKDYRPVQDEYCISKC